MGYNDRCLQEKKALVTGVVQLCQTMVRAGFKYSLGQPAKPTPWAAVTLSWQQP